MAQTHLKSRPECPRLRGWVEDIRLQLDARRKELRDSKDPVDQLRSKAIRVAKLKGDNAQLMVKLRVACKEEEDAAKRADGIRLAVAANTAEIEKLKEESRLLHMAGQEVGRTPADFP